MLGILALLLMQLPQNPSPMTESTREHGRLKNHPVSGVHHTLSVGTLLIPSGRLAVRPLAIHFHGESSYVEAGIHRWRETAAVISVLASGGSETYSAAIGSGEKFRQLLSEAEQKCKCAFKPVYLTSFSAGYGAVREILRDPLSVKRVDGVVLADSLHAGYETGDKPGPIIPTDLDSILDFARLAVKGTKRMLVAHSEVFPGTYASSTETADYLLTKLGLKRKPVLRWGVFGMQQLSEVHSGSFQILGYAGNSAPDHIDHFHAIFDLLKRL